jgi:dihydropteroate synthase
MNVTVAEAAAIDQALSNRHIDLDPGGYFIIYIDADVQQIYAKHFSNIINDRGLACDPETGEPFPCDANLERLPTRIYSGRTAKEICVKIFEQDKPCPITQLDHAAYLGREFQRAEQALATGQIYIQD